MPDSLIAQIPPQELAERLDQGEPLQVLDVRAPEKVAAGHVALGAALDFRAMPNSKLLGLSSLDPVGLDRTRPDAVICNRGNSSKKARAFRGGGGSGAFSVTGGRGGGEKVYVAR